MLPKGFTKIRQIGLWAPSNLSTRLEVARALLAGRVHGEAGAEVVSDAEGEPEVRGEGDGWASLLLALTGIDAERCPGFGQRALVEVPLSAPTPEQAARAPPSLGGPRASEHDLTLLAGALAAHGRGAPGVGCLWWRGRLEPPSRPANTRALNPLAPLLRAVHSAGAEPWPCRGSGLT